MVVPGLVLSLALFFEVDFLLVCLENAEQHANVPEDMGDLIREAQIPVAFAEPDKVLDIVRESSTSPTTILVSCDEFNSSYDSFSAKDFRGDLVWLVPEEALLAWDGPDRARLPLRLDSNLLSHTKDPFRSSISVYEHYSARGNPIKGFFGRWSGLSGLDVPTRARWERRSDLGGAGLVATAEEWRPLNSFDEGGGPVGLMADVMDILRAELNFTLDVIRPPDGEWGAKNDDDNGSYYWSGMVGQLARGEADIGAAGMTLTRERNEAIDYSVVLLEDTLSLTVSTVPVDGLGEGGIRLDVFLTVFTGQTWAATLAMAALISAACAAIFSKRRTDRKRNAAQWFGVSFYYFFLAFIQKNWFTGVGCPSVAAKVHLLTMSALCCILFNYYVGDLTATMTVGASVERLASFQDVVDKEYVVYTAAGTAFEDFFRFSPPDSSPRMVYESGGAHFRTIKASEAVEGFRRIARTVPRVAFFGSSFVFPGDNNLYHIPNFLESLETQIAFALQKDSELKPLLDFHLIKLVQSGIFYQLKSKWLGERKPPDWSGRIFSDDPAALGFDNLFFPAAVLAAGLAAGCLGACLEKCHHHAAAAAAAAAGGPKKCLDGEGDKKAAALNLPPISPT